MIYDSELHIIRWLTTLIKNWTIVICKQYRRIRSRFLVELNFFELFAIFCSWVSPISFGWVRSSGLFDTRTSNIINIYDDIIWKNIPGDCTILSLFSHNSWNTFLDKPTSYSQTCFPEIIVFTVNNRGLLFSIFAQICFTKNHACISSFSNE